MVRLSATGNLASLGVSGMLVIALCRPLNCGRLAIEYFSSSVTMLYITWWFCNSFCFCRILHDIDFVLATISALTASAITGGSPISCSTMVGGGAGSTVIDAAHLSSSLLVSASAFYADGVC